MNVRIFWVRAIKCMCALTRPRFILSSERVLGGMEFEPMLTPREKSPLPENCPRGGSNPRRCGQRAEPLPTSYSGPLISIHFCVESLCPIVITPWHPVALTVTDSGYVYGQWIAWPKWSELTDGLRPAPPFMCRKDYHQGCGHQRKVEEEGNDQKVSCFLFISCHQYICVVHFMSSVHSTLCASVGMLLIHLSGTGLFRKSAWT